MVRNVAFVLGLATTLLTSCSGGAGDVGSSPSPISGRQATIDVTAKFTKFANKAGEALEALNIVVRTNVPPDLRATVHVDRPDYIHDGDKRLASCAQGDSCLIHKGANVLDYWCTTSCPAGAYKVTIDVCSYVETSNDLCKDQEAGYMAFAGDLGANLAGNPLQQKDPSHAGILNLHAELPFTHP